MSKRQLKRWKKKRKESRIDNILKALNDEVPPSKHGKSNQSYITNSDGEQVLVEWQMPYDIDESDEKVIDNVLKFRESERKRSKRTNDICKRLNSKH